jgi:hypothetical protein
LAAIEVTPEGEFPDIALLAKQFPAIGARILGYLGKEAAVALAGMMESGVAGITFRSMDGNRKSYGGRRMITYSIGKGLKWVRVSSFPLNFFEGGRLLRSGVREAPRKILRGELRSAMGGEMSGLLGKASRLIVDDWFNRRHAGGMGSL